MDVDGAAITAVCSMILAIKHHHFRLEAGREDSQNVRKHSMLLDAPPSVHMDDESKFDWPLASLPDGERSGEGNFKKCQLHLSMCRYCRS